MPVTPVPTRNPGDYPDTVRHISNGDPVNQTFLRNPSVDLELRTEALRAFANAFATATGVNLQTLTQFLQQHNHSGTSGEQVLDFARIYANSDLTGTYFSLVANGSFAIKKNGGELADDLLKLDDAGTVPKDQIHFPGSTALFDHQAALASNLAVSPHGLKLAARPFVISEGCLVGSTANDTTITLDPTASVGALYAAPGLFGKTQGNLTTGALAEGVITGAVTDTSSEAPQNIVLVHVSGDLYVPGSEPVYGLLAKDSAGWKVSFRTKTGGAYAFTTAGGAKTLRLIGQEAFSLTTVPVVDPRFILMAKLGIKRI